MPGRLLVIELWNEVQALNIFTTKLPALSRHLPSLIIFIRFASLLACSKSCPGKKRLSGLVFPVQGVSGIPRLFHGLRGANIFVFCYFYVRYISSGRNIYARDMKNLFCVNFNIQKLCQIIRGF